MDDYNWIDQIECPHIKKAILELGFMGVITDPEIVAIFCDEAIELNPKIVATYKKGKTQVIGKLIGDVMRKTNSAVEPPELITQILEEKLK